MGLSLSQEEAGWEGSHKTKASQLMNAAPGGKDRGAAVVVGHAGLSWPSTASQGRGPSLLGEEMSEQPPLPIHPSGPTHTGGTEVSSPQGGHSHTQELSSTLSWRDEPSISQLQPPPNKCTMLPPLGWFCSSLFAFSCPEYAVANPSIFPPGAHVI